VLVEVGARNIGEQRCVTRIALLAGLPVALPVPGHRTRVDRVDGEPARPQRRDDQVLVGLDRDRNRHRVIAVLSQQRHQLPEPTHPGIDLEAAQDPAGLVHDRDVVVGLGPVDPAGDAHVPPRWVVHAQPEGTCGDLTEALKARHLTSRSRTRRLAGPPSTFRPRRPRASCEWSPVSGSPRTMHPTWTGEISGAPASRLQGTEVTPGPPIR
jgi:hypothetical protein